MLAACLYRSSNMLIGYVSNERYVAIPDVQLEFEGQGGSVEVRSRASGAVHVDLPPGEYLVTLAKAGYGSKRVAINVAGDNVGRSANPSYHFRLVSDG